VSASEDLRRLRDEAAARLEALEADFTDLVTASVGANADDEHDPEGTTIAYERSQLAALIDQTRTRVAELDHALQRAQEGSYGLCEVCGRLIPAQRLEARPGARRCVAHAV
jgi:RNA polymerase-binding transcription factor DksA